MDLTPAEARELLGAYVLDALDEEEWAAVEQRIAMDPDLARAAEELRVASAWLGAVETAIPPTDLRAHMLTRALGARPPGRSLTEPAAPVDAFAEQVRELADVLDTVPDDRWGLPTAAGFTVQELLAHLVAVEGYLLRVLGVGTFEPPPGTEADHVAMTQPTIDAYRDRPPAEVRAEWRALTDSTLRRLASIDEDALRERVSFHGLDVSTRSVLVMRVFELWTHADDIRRALGRELVAPTPGRLAIMSDTALRALPLGLAITGGAASGRTAKVVLTGPGGGTWLQPMMVGELPAEEPDVLIVADVVDYCRLAAQRLSPVDLECYVEGDNELAEAVLVGAAVFAA